jgi:hypothetical protein
MLFGVAPSTTTTGTSTGIVANSDRRLTGSDVNRSRGTTTTEVRIARAYFGGPTRSTTYPAARIEARSSWQCSSSLVDTMISSSVCSAVVVRPSR